MNLVLLALADPETATGWAAIVKHNGIAIAITGMLIVFSALTIIAIVIALVPHLLKLLAPILPKMHMHRAPPTRAEQTATDRDKIVAAIGFVLHTEMQKAAKNP